MTDIILSNLLL